MLHFQLVEKLLKIFKTMIKAEGLKKKKKAKPSSYVLTTGVKTQ